MNSKSEFLNPVENVQVNISQNQRKFIKIKGVLRLIFYSCWMWRFFVLIVFPAKQFLSGESLSL